MCPRLHMDYEYQSEVLVVLRLHGLGLLARLHLPVYPSLAILYDTLLCKVIETVAYVIKIDEY